ncbi:unnamed protein product [Caenorhabditis angaria]|uniref:Uncharacterized protein n=1 Tax=Caenorhabditis angaria TaxID=860376 RepID=A0A9P1IDE7_9PELO|nr:unnamed protein product [Caenorhabditis angaria]
MKIFSCCAKQRASRSVVVKFFGKLLLVLILMLQHEDIHFYLDICITSSAVCFPAIVLYILYKKMNSAFLRKIRCLFRIQIPVQKIKISPPISIN